MKLTAYTDYSLRVLIYLAAQPERMVSTEEISNAYGISLNHLVKVVNELGKRGYLEIRRGRNGGVLLGKSPVEINVGDVVAEMEPDFYIVECFNQKKNACPITPSCKLKGVLAEAHQAFMETLKKYTLADLVTVGNRSNLLELFLSSGKKTTEPVG